MKVPLKTFPSKLFAILLPVLLLAGNANAQVSTFQDCLGATPICLGSYSNGNLITGTGNYPNEINAVNSCLLTGERNDVWYIITTGSAGNLAFSIVPVNAAHNYDWAVYNLTSSVCSDIFTNPALEVSCNYSSLPGTTGANGQAGAQNNPVIPVLAGQTYLINVSGFSSINQSGYTIDLTASTAGIIDNTTPSVSSVTAMNCGATSMTVSFSERVLCSSVQATDFTLTGPGGPYTINSVSSVSCTAGAPYSRDYIISFSPAIQTAGNYSVNLTGTVTDLCANNAVVPQAFQVPISGVNISFQKVDVTCFGGNNGSATAVVTGPPGPYTYQWSPMGGTGPSAQWLTAGTYTLTVTTALGCSATGTVTINQPLTGITATATTTPSNGCAANGTATVTVSNGQPPYLYSWWPSGGNAATATGLTSGGYMVTITDANQCVLNYFLNVPSGSGPSISITGSSNVSCFGGSDGSATVTVNNATGPFSYNWSPSGGTGATATGLSAGNYTVDVIVAPGCTLTTGVTIVQPPTALNVNVSLNHTSCGNNNGTISLSASGGAGSYSYQWSPNVSSGNSASGLPGGSYTITVTDGNGCTSVNNVVIDSSTQPVPSLVNHQDVSCFGLSDGSTGITVTGGALPLSYNWSSGQTASIINNIAAGTYTVTVTDVFGCSAVLSDVINQPAEMTVSVVQLEHVKCFGELTGSIVLATAGGNGNNSWTWTGNVASGPSASNVAAGNYTATVIDQLGCNASIQIVINQPLAPLVVTGTITETTCGNTDGAISTVVTGGTSPHTYLWNNGNTSSSLTSLSPGIYTITITDINSCIITQSFTVQASDAPVISTIAITNVTCFGGNNGGAALNVTGGVQPYTWIWQGGVSSGASAANLVAGNYNVTVTDVTGCSSFHLVSISQPDILTASVNVPVAICIGQQATVTAGVSGGVPPYSYSWSTGSIQSQINISPAVTSTYTLSVSDANGCITNAQPAIVNVYPPLSLSATFPDSVCRGTSATISLNAGGGDGNYSYQWSNGMTGSVNNIIINNDTAITIILTDGCSTPQDQVSAQIVAVNSPDITFTLDPQAGCAPFEAKFDVPPGLPPGLIFEWDFGDNYTSAQASPLHTYLQPGIYNVQLEISYAVAPICSTVLDFSQAVNVYEVPVTRFIFDPPSPTLSQPEIYFTDRSTGAVSWHWSFGDGNGSSDQHPRYAYRDTGIYVVSLRVQSQEGCRDSTANIVHVRDEMQVFIPNAFTPNNSGVNDYFKVYGVGFVSYEMSIFDRWGKQVYYAKNTEQAWDGTDMATGKPVPQGLYVYRVTIIDNSGTVHNRFNHVTVIR